MHPFKAFIPESRSIEGEDGRFEAVGHRSPFVGVWDITDTIPAHRLMVFHAPIRVVFPNGRTYPIEEDTLFFLPAFRRVRYGSDAAEWTHSWFRFTGTMMARRIEKAGILAETPYFLGSGTWTTLGEPWLLAIYTELTTRGGDGASARDLFGVLVRKLGRRITLSNGTRPSLDEAEREDYRLARARRVLEMRSSENISTADLAGEAGLSVSHFCTIFSKCYGMSPLEFRLKLRVERAKALLRESRLSIGRVADECGFSDPYHFSRIFKRETGSTPSTFRREL